MEILKLDNVVKKFGGQAVVKDVSFSADKGRILGLIGPNGAGKTTLIRMITNILFPDEGDIMLFGKPVGPEHQNMIGYLPEERGLYKKSKVLAQIIYFAQLKGLSKTEASARARYWLEKLGAPDWEGKKVMELSKGMQQKVQFISTILHEPEMLILDEPFSGFDPVNTELLKNIILEMKDKGKTILLSTHVMEQAEQLCDDICLINRGEIVLKGNIRDIKKERARDTVVMEFEGDGSFLDSFSGLKIQNKSTNRYEFRMERPEMKNEILRKSLDTINIFKFEIMEPSLHEIFIDTVSNSNGGENGQ